MTALAMLALFVAASSTGQAQTGYEDGFNAEAAPSEVQPAAVVRLPATQASGNAKVTALETRLAEVEAQLQKAAEAEKKAADEKKKKGYVIGSDPALAGKWTNDGPTFQSKNADFKFHPRGVAQLDWIGVQNPSSGVTGIPGGAGTQDAVDFRRLRLGAEGTMYQTIDWVFEFDFAFALQNIDQMNSAAPSLGLRSFPTGTGVQAGNVTNSIQPTTIFMTFTELPVVGNIRVGNQQSWISLEHIESARFLDFMERSPLMDAFNGANNNGYAPGVSLFRMTENKRAAFELGGYRNNVYDSGFPYSIGNNNYTLGGRTTWTPYYDEPSEGRYMLHTGIGAEFRGFNDQPLANTDGTNVRLRARGDVRNTDSVLDPNFVDTGNFYAGNQCTFCPEMAFQWGPWLLQAEYQQAYMNSAYTRKGGTKLGQVMFQGGYVQALYFLTGENRNYNRQSGVYGRVIPYENAFATRGAGCYGLGAWQVGLRYDWLDLNSGQVQGGQLQDLTAGLNWFLNPNTRFQFNYVMAWVNNSTATTAPGTVGSLNGSRFTGEGIINSFGGRFDWNF